MLGLQYYGECWVTESTMGRVLPMHSNDCFDEIFKKCHSGSVYCAGTDKTTVLYELGEFLAIYMHISQKLPSLFFSHSRYLVEKKIFIGKYKYGKISLCFNIFVE